MAISKTQTRLVDAETGEVVLENVEVARSAWHRFRGLMLRREIASGHGLLIERCGSVHTMWMRFSIDVFFLSQDGTVVDLRCHVRPWRIAISRAKASRVLETLPGQTRLQVGTRVRIE